MFSLSRFLPLTVYSVRSPGQFTYTLYWKGGLSMKYEAPKAVVVDFENDYVAAVGGVPSKTA